MRATPGNILIENTTLEAGGAGCGRRRQRLRHRWTGLAQTARFDISAKMPTNTPMLQLLEMMQTLLSERFKVAVHQETRELPMYALVPQAEIKSFTRSGMAKLPNMGRV